MLRALPDRARALGRRKCPPACAASAAPAVHTTYIDELSASIYNALKKRAVWSSERESDPPRSRVAVYTWRKFRSVHQLLLSVINDDSSKHLVSSSLNRL
eukprot:4346610-Pyramimonas_sp.AAC.1